MGWLSSSGQGQRAQCKGFGKSKSYKMNRQKRREPVEIILLLLKYDASHLSQEQFCQQKQISVDGLHRWGKKNVMMDVEGAKRLKALKKENIELRCMRCLALRCSPRRGTKKL